jgi:hypothetical protein
MSRIITPSELHHLGPEELRALFRKVSETLAQTEPGTRERRAAQASLENIRQAMARPAFPPRPKPPGF